VPRSSFLRRHKTGVSLLALVVALTGAFGSYKVARLSAEPSGDKRCPAPDDGAGAQIDLARVRAIAPLKEVTWSQLGGSINDASCLDKTDVYGIVAVKTAEDISRVLAFARDNKLTVSPAGVRHSMGGQALRKGGIVLDMRGFNAIALDPAAKTIRVQAGASWHDIQNKIHPRFAVLSMQSTDIFTVGGSISVNGHGMDHQAGSIARSIRSMRVMLADGSVVECSATQDRELFDLVVGGYGLFGVVLDAELTIVDNLVYRTGREVIDYTAFPDLFAKTIEPDKSIGLMYGHLSTAPSSFLREMLLYTYTQVDDTGATRAPLGEPVGTKLRRLTMNLAKKSSLFQEIKWYTEKNIEHRVERCTVTRAQAIASGEACLVSRNDPMHDSVPYLRNDLAGETDILHEYFIPRGNFVTFVDGMRKILTEHDATVLNASVRIVHPEDNFLTYAPEPAFAVVLYVNQRADAEGNRRMQALTGALIELTLAQRGRFFLPYQLHYTVDQLKHSYPQIGAFFAAKRKYDPQGIFTNTFYEKYGDAGT
jgi:FAD/FMN-containing dehydrogenase